MNERKLDNVYLAANFVSYGNEKGLLSRELLLCRIFCLHVCPTCEFSVSCQIERRRDKCNMKYKNEDRLTEVGSSVVS